MTEAHLDRALALARITALRFAGSLPAIDWEDLHAEARIAAWQALLTWDAARSALDTWVIFQCRSAALQFLRRNDPLTRSERREYREAEAAWELAQARGESGPARPELPRVILSLETPIAGGDESMPPLPLRETLAGEDDRIERVVSRIAAAERLSRLLPLAGNARAQSILWLYGGLGLSCEEVGERLGLSANNVSFIFNAALARIRRRLMKRPPGTTWQEAFLEAIRAGQTTRAATRAARVYRQTPYKCAERNPQFAKAWEKARAEGLEKWDE